MKTVKSRGIRAAKAILAVSVAASALVASAGFEQIDGKDYWRDDDGVLHQYLYLKGHSKKIWGATFLDQPSDATTVPWVANSIFVASSNITYNGVWAFQDEGSMPDFLYGLCFQKRNDNSGYYSFSFPQVNLGAYGIRAEAARVVVRGYDTMFNLVESQTWQGLPAESLSANSLNIYIPGYQNYASYSAGLKASADDVRFKLAGDMRLYVAATNNSLSACDVVVEKPAYLAVRRMTFKDTDQIQEGSLGARSLTLDGGTGLIFGSSEADTIPILSPARISPTVILTNGAVLAASAATTVTGGVEIVSAAGAANAVSGTYVLADGLTVFKAEMDATLDLSAADISKDAFFALSGSGKIVFGDDVRILDAAQLQNFSGTIGISSGTLYIPRAADIPASVKFETSGDGLLSFGDAAGFDAATRLSGTANMADGSSGLVITDVKRESASVGAGETLLVFGSGLDADGALSLAAGVKVLFCKTATIAAPITQSGAVTFETYSPAVTGTVSGVYTASAGALTVVSPGLLRLAFSGTADSTLYGLTMKSGHAEITTGRINCLGHLTFNGGYLTIKDGGRWYFGEANYMHLQLNQTQTEDATLEIGPGGYCQPITANHHGILIGADKNHSSRLFINGGELRQVTANSFTIDGNGILEIDNGGILRTVRNIAVGDGGLGDRCGIILGNGTFCSFSISSPTEEGDGASNAYRNYMKYGDIIAGGAVPVTVRGDFLFDLSTFAGNFITNQSATATSVWKFENGGRLRVKGSNKRFIIKEGSMPHAALDLTTELPGATVSFFPTGDGEGGIAPQSVEWTVPTNGVTAGAIEAFEAGGQDVPLVASYRVPENAEFSAAAMTGWATGFTDGGVSNLTFEAGSAWRIPAFPFSPLALLGTLSLPTELSCTVVVGGPVSPGTRGETVAMAAEGAIGADCVFSCKGEGRSLKGASMAVDGSSVVFSYSAPGFMLLVR